MKHGVESNKTNVAFFSAAVDPPTAIDLDPKNRCFERLDLPTVAPQRRWHFWKTHEAMNTIFFDKWGGVYEDV